ncbi:DUF1801 domain-containing protein [Methanolobus sp. ZRKC2]|uniref:DUF5655 domain-containing protein n=1 Tax=Methanolobus sp. ZRKC2 TaxID=3125783 RepID=UPI003255B2E4
MKVKEYIEKQKHPEKEILEEARKTIYKTFPGCDEKFEWGVLTFKEGKFYLAALKDRVHVGFSIIGLSAEELKLFEGSGKTARHIKLHSIEDIQKKEIVKIMKIVDEKVTEVPK